MVHFQDIVNSAIIQHVYKIEKKNHRDYGKNGVRHTTFKKPPAKIQLKIGILARQDLLPGCPSG